MREVKVLFFTADPRLGRPGGESLDLAEDLRKIKLRVKGAKFGAHLRFEAHGAAQPDDLIDLLADTDAKVMHFSGHGGRRGLRFVGSDGETPHHVTAAALERLFRNRKTPVRLAVLSACSSHAEAQAIADVVGCAIGTLSPIGDDAAITFNSRFYEALANGCSVDVAHEAACAALQVHRIPEQEYPQVFVRDEKAKPADIVFFRTVRLVRTRAAVALAACAVTAAAMIYVPPVPREPTVSDIVCGSDAAPAEGIRTVMRTQGANATTPSASSGPASSLATAKAFYRDRNYDAARAAFLHAARNGNGEAMGCLGYMYLAGRGKDSLPSEGFEWVHKGAEEEREPHAMYALANAYLSGVGTDAREHLARYWFQEARKLGFAEAMRSLGDLYRQEMNDSGYRQALIMYQEAVDHGSLNARVDQGMMYEFGWGVRRDVAAAFRMYRSAAATPRGMWAVGQSYQNGLGVAVDYDSAMAWYRRAAAEGFADAMNSIGVLYDTGLGIHASRRMARRWYIRAEKAGSRLAAGNLGRFVRE